jgi:hypothetical protein
LIGLRRLLLWISYIKKAGPTVLKLSEIYFIFGVLSDHHNQFKNYYTMLPKFLLADNSQVLPDTIFIIHTEQPRFIVGCDLEGFNVDQEIHWIDEEPESKELKADLLEQAEEFMELELEYEEELDKLEED